MKRIRVGKNTLDMWAEDADWDSVEGVRIFTEMKHADNPEYVNARFDEATKARSLGLKVYLLIDYFTRFPYHAPPAHHNIKDTRNYPRSGGPYKAFPDVELEQRVRGRHDAFGLLHFSWIDGWRWGEEAVRTLVDATDPDFIQQGDDPATLVGWDYYKPTAGPIVYNDTMGVFRGGINRTAWKGSGTYVVADWRSRTIPRAREYFGSAMSADEFEFITVPYVDDDDDDGGTPVNYRQEVERNLEEIEGRPKKGGGTNKKLVRLEKDAKTFAAALRILINDHDLIMDDMFGDD